jgi:beta-hydroxylase
MHKTVKQSLILAAILTPLGIFAPKIALLYCACGLYDVLRNRKRDLGIVLQYFVGNGSLTWLLSPFNVLMDLLTLPYVNKGIYRREDLPPAYQAEIQRLIDAAHAEDLVGKLEERAAQNARTMVFFKWYGTNVDSFVTIPAFHERYRYIQTIGVSVFNKRQSTSRHFGPLRATLRVLYNINPIASDATYIEVGPVQNRWRESPLFIFDDTLLHQSFNETDEARYCLFVDILRPSLLAPLFRWLVGGIRFFLKSVNFLFYKNWEVIKN